MDTEINIATYDENGVPVVRPMTETELAEFAEMQAIAPIVPLPTGADNDNIEPV